MLAALDRLQLRTQTQNFEEKVATSIRSHALPNALLTESGRSLIVYKPETLE